MDNKLSNESDTNSEIELKYMTCTNDQICKEHCLQNIPHENSKIQNNKDDKKEENDKNEKTKYDKISNKIKNIYTKNRKKFRCLLYSLLLILFHIYLIFAVIHSIEKAKDILIITGIFWIILLFFVTKNYILINGKNIKLCHGQNLSFYLNKFHKIWNKYKKNFKFQFIIYGIIFVGIAIFIERDTKNDRSRLQGLSGLCFFIIFMFTFSKSKKNVCIIYIFIILYF